MRRPVLALSLLLATAVIAAPAQAAGGPVAGADAGGAGVTVPASAVRVVAVPMGDRTLVMRIERTGGTVQRSRSLPGRWVVPAAAGDLTGTGMSADGTTVVLGPERSRFPIRRTRLPVLDARTLKPRRTIALRGDFTVDAISPDGRLLYLVQYTSRTDISQYVVRAYDMGDGRLRPDPVVDPAEADEPMRGAPLARSYSADGRWAYTLYDGAGAHPFVHALDTQTASAKCVDLDQLAGRDDLWTMRLRTGPSGAVTVVGETGPELTIDPRTFAVRDAVSAPAAPPRAGEAGGVPALAVAGLAALALLAAAVLMARRGRPRIGSA